MADFGPVFGQSWAQDRNQRLRLERRCINQPKLVRARGKKRQRPETEARPTNAEADRATAEENGRARAKHAQTSVVAPVLGKTKRLLWLPG